MSALVVPDRGAEQQVAQILLSLAHSPADVQTNTDSGLAFVVPDYLADAYEAAVAPPSESAATAAPKRGRTRKDQS